MSERTFAEVHEERLNAALGVSLGVDAVRRAQSDDAIAAAAASLAKALDYYISRSTQGWCR